MTLGEMALGEMTISRQNTLFNSVYTTNRQRKTYIQQKQ